MDYAYSNVAANAQLGAPQTSTLPLERVAENADRVDRLAYAVEKFNERFFVGKCEAESGGNCREVPRGHAGEIDRLSIAIDRLDTAVQTLGNIG